MLNDQVDATSTREDDDVHIRDIHALTPPQPVNHVRPRETWETNIHGSSSFSTGSDGASSENFTSISREFNALVIAGSAITGNNINGNNNNNNNNNDDTSNGSNNLARIGEDDDHMFEETNPLAIVPDNNPMNPVPSPRYTGSASSHSEVSVQRVKKEEAETKISAWQTAKIAKINNRLKREDAIISVWEREQVQKATSRMKKVERKLEEKRARALEKMQNEVAKAHRKAEERKASAEAKRGSKVARVLEIANLMRAVGRPPAKRAFF
ncbi:remorin 4.2-like [Cornus florida]|uniref:remorin 4.2-like n=1 Tax=Cornus florida TaxID=4283 RepID=UPI00289A8309|nr:remorin 4.2-like [Cornus florida]